MKPIRQAALLSLLERYAPPGIPPTYLLALAARESSLDPAKVNPVSNATGLFQVTDVVLRDFNERHGTTYKLADLVSPELAVLVGTWHIARVIKLLATHPSTRPDFTSRRFVELLTLAWNAGHNGLARLVGLLEQHGIPDARITVDAVREAAVAAGASPYLADPNRVAWAKSVASLFLGQHEAPVVATSEGSPAAAIGIAALGLTAAGALAARADTDPESEGSG